MEDIQEDIIKSAAIRNNYSKYIYLTGPQLNKLNISMKSHFACVKPLNWGDDFRGVLL